MLKHPMKGKEAAGGGGAVVSDGQGLAQNYGAGAAWRSREEAASGLLSAEGQGGRDRGRGGKQGRWQRALAR